MKDREQFNRLHQISRENETTIQLYPKFSYDDQLIMIEISYSESFDMSLLNQFSNIRNIKFTNNYMKEIDFSLFSHTDKLRKIEITDCISLEKINFGTESYLNLELLRISRTNLSALDLNFLRTAPMLQELLLHQVSNTDYIERGFSRYTWWYRRRYYQDCEDEGLDRYDLEGSYYPSNLAKLDLDPINNHPSIRILDLSYNEGTEILMQNIPPPNLEIVDLSYNTIKELGLHHLATKNLLSVKLERAGLEEIDLQGIEKSKILQEINIRHNKINMIDLYPIRKLKEIRSLNLSRNRIKEIDLKPLANLVKLKYLILESNDLEEIDLSPLSNLPLTHILLGDSKIKSIDLTPLKSIPTLQVLRLTRNQLESIDLEPLTSCRFLKKLQLARNQLKKLSLEALRGKIHLNELNLDRNPFEEVDMSPLEDIPQIDFIDITSVSNKTSIDITPILKQHSGSWVNVSDEEKFEIDVKEIKEINLEGNPLIEHPAVIDAINFKENSRELLGAKTKTFAVKAAENHDDIIDLLTQRMLEERNEVSKAILNKLREIKKNKKDSGSETNTKTSH